MVASELDAQARQLFFGTALHEQRHEIPDRAPVELRMSVVNDRGDGIGRYMWIVVPQPVDQLFNRRPFTRADFTHTRHVANFAFRFRDSQQLAISA